MTVYWFINHHGQQMGTLNKHKRDCMAEQNYCDDKQIGECNIAEFKGKLLNDDFD